MLEKLRNKRKDKKGFTLVELIVVLIILAILAALLIPALTGYIDKAKDKQIIAETRQAVMAAQTLADEVYAKGEAAEFDSTDTNPEESGGTRDAKKVYAYDIKKLGEVTGTIKSMTINEGKITELVYEHADKTCTYTKGDTTEYAVTKTQPTT